MSLYNALFGVNKLAGFYLSALNLTHNDVGRFRDCHLAKTDSGELRIVVFTRNGGGNREDYEHVTEALRAHPEYVQDFDDDFDSTYASYVFKVPKSFLPMVQALADDPGQQVDPMARFKSLIEKMQADKDDDPEVKRAIEIGKQILGPIVEELKKEPK